MEACLKDMKEWMAHNFLLLNSGKTEILVVRLRSIIVHVLLHLYRMQSMEAILPLALPLVHCS